MNAFPDRRTLPAARFVAMRTAGHMGPVTHAEEFAALCRNFIAAAQLAKRRQA